MKILVKSSVVLFGMAGVMAIRNLDVVQPGATREIHRHVLLQLSEETEAPFVDFEHAGGLESNITFEDQVAGHFNLSDFLGTESDQQLGELRNKLLQIEKQIGITGKNYSEIDSNHTRKEKDEASEQEASKGERALGEDGSSLLSQVSPSSNELTLQVAAPSCPTCLRLGDQYCFLELHRNKTNGSQIDTLTTGNGVCCTSENRGSDACNQSKVLKMYGPDVKLKCLSVEDQTRLLYPDSLQPVSDKSSRIYDQCPHPPTHCGGPELFRQNWFSSWQAASTEAQLQQYNPNRPFNLHLAESEEFGTFNISYGQDSCSYHFTPLASENEMYEVVIRNPVNVKVGLYFRSTEWDQYIDYNLFDTLACHQLKFCEVQK